MVVENACKYKLLPTQLRGYAVAVKNFAGYKTVTIFFHRESVVKSERPLASCHLSLFLCLFCRELHRALYRESKKRYAEHPIRECSVLRN